MFESPPATHRTEMTFVLDASAPPWKAPEEPPSALVQCVMQVLDHHAEGIAVVDEDAQLVYANPIARRTLTESGWLNEDQRVRCPQGNERNSWIKALRGACDTQVHSMLELSGSSQGRSDCNLFLAVAPLSVGSNRYAMLTLGRQEVCGTLELLMFAKRFTLSNAEREVLTKLCQGHKPSAIADLHGVSVSTVITQLTAIRTKTSTANLRELLHKVARLPSLRPLN